VRRVHGPRVRHWWRTLRNWTHLFADRLPQSFVELPQMPALPRKRHLGTQQCRAVPSLAGTAFGATEATAFVDGFTRRTLGRLIGAGRDNTTTPTLALSPRPRHHWARSTPLEACRAQAVAAEALSAQPSVQNLPVRPARRALGEAGASVQRRLGPTGLSTDGHGLSAGLSLHSSRSILPAWQECPSQPSRQAGIRASGTLASGRPCRFATGDAPAAGLVTTSATWCGLIAGARIQAVCVKAGPVGLAFIVCAGSRAARLGAAPIRGRVYQ
jgi:hypothetical protein